MNPQEKEAYAETLMAEMKLKNEKLKERYKEVQKDRERAEKRNSSITTSINAKKGAIKDTAPKEKPEREWDKGKRNPDSVYWDSKHHEYSRNTSYSVTRIRNDDSQRSGSTLTSNKETCSFCTKYNSKTNEKIRYCFLCYNDTNSSSCLSQLQFLSLIKIHGTKNSSHQSCQSSKLNDHPKKDSNISFKSSDFKMKPGGHSMIDGMDEPMWQCGGRKNEAQRKLNRVEKWVNSINKNCEFNDTSEELDMPEEYKYQVKCKNIGSHQERSEKYGLGEESSNRKAKGQTHLRMKEKSENKCNQYFSNSSGCGNKISTVKCCSIPGSKNQVKRKLKYLSERLGQKFESDMSDYASSMNESDDLDWGRNKIIRAGSTSQSSEDSCGRGRGKEDETCDEEKAEETISMESKYSSQKCPQDKDQNKYGSKFIFSRCDSVNYEYKINGGEKESFDYGKYNQKLDATCHGNGEDHDELSEKSFNITGVYSLPHCLGVTESEFSSVSLEQTAEYLENRRKKFYNDTDTDTDTYSLLQYSGVPKSEISSSVSCAQTADCLENKGTLKNSDCVIIEPLTSDRSLPQDTNCGGVYINRENAENSIALRSQQNESCGSRSPEIKTKRYSLRRKFVKPEKRLRKSKLSVDKKVTDKSLANEVNSKNRKKDSETVNLYTDSKLSVDKKVTGKSLGKKVKSKNLEKDDTVYLHTDSNLSDNDRLMIPSSAKNVKVKPKNQVKPKNLVKPALGRKQILTENTKRMDDANISALNLSDDEWSTITDND